VSLVVGQRMVRTDDGMRGVVELVSMPGFEQYEELRIVYVDRGEKRIAGKREVWEPEKAPSRKLREEEISYVAHAANQALRCIDLNEPSLWWRNSPSAIHDHELFNLITDYLSKRI
jgi:hypothetical protein